MFALEIIRLASAFVAVCSIVLARQAVHDVEVIGTGPFAASTVFRKVTAVDRLPARCSSNLDLQEKSVETMFSQLQFTASNSL